MSARRRSKHGLTVAAGALVVLAVGCSAHAKMGLIDADGASCWTLRADRTTKFVVHACRPTRAGVEVPTVLGYSHVGVAGHEVLGGRAPAGVTAVRIGSRAVPVRAYGLWLAPAGALDDPVEGLDARGVVVAEDIARIDVCSTLDPDTGGCPGTP